MSLIKIVALLGLLMPNIHAELGVPRKKGESTQAVKPYPLPKNEDVLRCLNSLEDGFTSGPFMGRFIQYPGYEEPDYNDRSLRTEVMAGTHNGDEGIFILSPGGTRFLKIPRSDKRRDEFKFQMKDRNGIDVFVRFYPYPDEAYGRFSEFTHFPESNYLEDVFSPENYIPVEKSAKVDFSIAMPVAEKLIVGSIKSMKNALIDWKAIEFTTDEDVKYAEANISLALCDCAKLNVPTVSESIEKARKDMRLPASCDQTGSLDIFSIFLNRAYAESMQTKVNKSAKRTMSNGDARKSKIVRMAFKQRPAFLSKKDNKTLICFAEGSYLMESNQNLVRWGKCSAEESQSRQTKLSDGRNMRIEGRSVLIY